MDLRPIDGEIAKILGWKNIRDQLVKGSPEDDSVYPIDEDNDAWDRSRAFTELIGTPPSYVTDEVERIPHWSSTWKSGELFDWFLKNDIHVYLNSNNSGTSINLLRRGDEPFNGFPVSVLTETPHLAIAVAFLKFHGVEYLKLIENP